MFSGRFACFKCVLVCVVAVLGCAWPSWLFYVASGVKKKLGCFKLFVLFFGWFFTVYNCLLVV